METSNQDVTEDSQKKVEAVNTTLNRLIAGDFLESLGKELGLEVPTDMPHPENKTSNPAKKDTVPLDLRAKSSNQSGNGTSSTSHAVVADLSDPVLAVGNNNQNISQEGIFSKEGTVDISSWENGGRGTGTESYRNDVDKNRFEMEARTHAKAKGDQYRNKNSSLSEDEADRKRKRPHRSSSPDASSDSSKGYKDRHSRSRKKKTSQEKSSSSKRHSKHHKHRRRDSRSPSRHSRHVSEKDRREAKREKRKYKD